MTSVPAEIIAREPAHAGTSSGYRLHAGESLFSPGQRIDYLQQFGIHSQHFTALQPGMKYFDVPGVGYLSYAVKWGQPMVLGDPVAHPTDTLVMLRRFFEVYPKASFIQVSGPTAKLLHDEFGYFGTQFGQEQKVPLEGWTVSGKSRKGIRKAVNQAKEKGIVVRESHEALDVDDVCSDWLQTRKVRGREIRFMVRPRKMEHTQGTRYFYAWKDDRPIGFAYFDPGYFGGQVKSYLPNISRACSAFRQGIFYTIMVHAIETFRNEGVQWIDLGLNPMVLDDQAAPHENRFVRSVFSLVYRFGRHYNFQGLHFTKKRFGGEWAPTFYCHRKMLPIADMGRMAGLVGLF